MENNFLAHIDEQLVFFVESSTKDGILSYLSESIAHKVSTTHPHYTPDVIFKTINQREKLMTTGIGMGVAIPHAKIPAFPSFTVAVAILQQGLEWDAVDESLVRIIFMIVGPDDKPGSYLSLLSNLTHVIRSDEARRKLLNATNAQTVKETLLEYTPQNS